MEQQKTREEFERLREKYSRVHLNRVLLEAEYELLKEDVTVPSSARVGLQKKLEAYWNEELRLEMQIKKVENTIRRAKQCKEVSQFEFIVSLLSY